MKPNNQSSSPEFITFLVAKLHDKSFDNCQLLYNKMKELDIPITSLTMNYLLQNAV
jgi:hypothetical protein